MDNVVGTTDVTVRTSATLGELAKALAEAQAEFPAVTKDRTARIESSKGGYSYNYADLADVLEAVRKPLAKHGLAIVQPMAWNGHPWLVTRLIHGSGEWIESIYPMATFERAQEMGSAITYARRYALTALLGVAPEDDDDGAAATAAKPRPAGVAPPPKASGPKADCPNCGGSAWPSKFPKPGATHYCRECAATFEPPKEVL